MDPVLAEQFEIRIMDVMMKILLPACFITLKLTGTYIDFMIGLSNSEQISPVRDSQAKSFDSLKVYDS